MDSSSQFVIGRYSKPCTMTAFVVVGLLATFTGPCALADYSPLSTAADGVESHVADTKVGMQLIAEALRYLPYKLNITTEANETDFYSKRLREQIAERRTQLEIDSSRYYKLVESGLNNLTDQGSKQTNSLFGKTNEAIQHRIKTARVILAHVKQELLNLLNSFREDASSVQADQTDQVKREVEVLVEILDFLVDNFKNQSHAQIKKDFSAHIYLQHVDKYHDQRGRIKERYFHLPPDYLKSSTFSLSWQSASLLYKTLFEELPLDDNQVFLRSAELVIQAKIFPVMFPILNKNLAGFFMPDVNYTHDLLETLTGKHLNISHMLDDLRFDFFQEERDLLRKQKVNFVELLFEMATARESFRTIAPLLETNNALTLVLLTVLLLLLLALIVAFAYWATPQDDCRIYIRPPLPTNCIDPVY